VSTSQYAHTKKKNPASTRARLIKYSKKLGDYILGEIEKGRTLTAICREEGIPSHATVHKWVREDAKGTKWEGFGDAYKTARETQLNYFIDQMHDIADQPPPVPPQFVRQEDGQMTELKGDERKLWVNAENMRRRLKVDAIKFQAGKLAGVMGYNLDKGIVVTGDVVNILNYSTIEALPHQKLPTEKEVKVVNFIEVKNEET